MIEKLLTVVLLCISTIVNSQDFKFGIKAGPVLSEQTLRSESLINIPGVNYNTIGGIPYDVNAYTGYNLGLNLEILFKLFPDDYNKRVKTYLGFRSGFNYSSQGAIVEDVNRTSFINQLNYIQYPILLSFRMNNFIFFIGPQLSNILRVKTDIKASTNNIDLNTTSKPISFTFSNNDFGNKETSFVYGFGYKIYDYISFEIKSTRGLTNISRVVGEVWKNKSYDISIHLHINDFIKKN